MRKSPLTARQMAVLGVLTGCVVGSFVALCYLAWAVCR